MISNKLKVLLLTLLGAVACLSTVSYMSNPSTSETTIQTLSGERYIISDHFSIQSNKAITPVSSTMPASRTITWTNQTSAHTELASGHWQLTVNVKINSNAQPNTAYTISLRGGADSSMSQLGSIRFMTSDVVTAGEMMSFVFDVGAELDSSMVFVAQII